MCVGYAVVVITPDSIRDGLRDCIIYDLFSEVDATILWCKYWQINSAETVEKIYPDLSDKISYSAVIRTMLMGPCFVLLVEGVNIYKKLKKAKGQIKYDNGCFMVSGLREKYRSWSEEELYQLGKDSQKALYKIFEFRLHTSDDLTDTANFCLLCMTKKEILNLRTLAPSLYCEMMAIKLENKAT